MSAKHFWLTLMAAAALAGAGCAGSGDDSSESSTDTGDMPSKAEYIAQADEICREAEDEFSKELEGSFEGDSPSQEEVGAALREGAARNLEGQLNDLRALTPPAGDEQTLASMYDTLEVAVDRIAADPSSLTGQPSAEMEEASRLAEEYGLKVCGN